MHRKLHVTPGLHPRSSGVISKTLKVLAFLGTVWFLASPFVLTTLAIVLAAWILETLFL